MISKSAISSALAAILSQNLSENDQAVAIENFCDELAEQIANVAKQAVESAVSDIAHYLEVNGVTVTGTISLTQTVTINP